MFVIFICLYKIYFCNFLVIPYYIIRTTLLFFYKILFQYYLATINTLPRSIIPNKPSLFLTIFSTIPKPPQPPSPPTPRLTNLPITSISINTLSKLSIPQVFIVVSQFNLIVGLSVTASDAFVAKFAHELEGARGHAGG